MTDCPPRLRGDLSKWLCEINTGVYVGHVSSHVRDALWDRVCQNLKSGRGTMVYLVAEKGDSLERGVGCVSSLHWDGSADGI